MSNTLSQTGIVKASVNAVGALCGKISIPFADGDFIPVPTTAEVGQTIVVKAVDESGKPTEWAVSSMAEWKRIGTFTAADNINPWIIDADENNKPFAYTEFRIIAKISWFCRSGLSQNRSIAFLGDDGDWYNLGMNYSGVFRVVTGDDVEFVSPDFTNPAVLDVTTHSGMIVADIANETLNNNGRTILSSSGRNRGVAHTAEKFTAIRLILGHLENLIFKDSALEIWGR